MRVLCAMTVGMTRLGPYPLGKVRFDVQLRMAVDRLVAPQR